MRNSILLIPAVVLFSVFVSCGKDNSQPGARTVDNLSGTYDLTALSVKYGSSSIDLYATLPDCVKGNTVNFGTDSRVNFTDVPPVCTPLADSIANWSLSANTDTLYIATDKYFINSWDGTTLVLDLDTVYMTVPAIVESTFVKQH